MSISSIVVRGFGAFANGLLATLGFGQPTPVGPGICAESAIFVGMGFEGTVLSESGVGYCLESTTAGAVVFNGGHEGAIIPMMSTGAEYT
jgi:hypothetical protein